MEIGELSLETVRYTESLESRDSLKDLSDFLACRCWIGSFLDFESVDIVGKLK